MGASRTLTQRRLLLLSRSHRASDTSRRRRLTPSSRPRFLRILHHILVSLRTARCSAITPLLRPILLVRLLLETRLFFMCDYVVDSPTTHRILHPLAPPPAYCAPSVVARVSPMLHLVHIYVILFYIAAKIP